MKFLRGRRRVDFSLEEYILFFFSAMMSFLSHKTAYPIFFIDCQNDTFVIGKNALHDAIFLGSGLVSSGSYEIMLLFRKWFVENALK